MEDKVKEEKIHFAHLEDLQKKAYQKPFLTKVRLVAGEAVLSTCKNGLYAQECLTLGRLCTLTATS